MQLFPAALDDSEGGEAFAARVTTANKQTDRRTDKDLRKYAKWTPAHGIPTSLLQTILEAVMGWKGVEIPPYPLEAVQEA